MFAKTHPCPSQVLGGVLVGPRLPSRAADTFAHLPWATNMSLRAGLVEKSEGRWGNFEALGHQRPTIMRTARNGMHALPYRKGPLIPSFSPKGAKVSASSPRQLRAKAGVTFFICDGAAFLPQWRSA